MSVLVISFSPTQWLEQRGVRLKGGPDHDANAPLLLPALLWARCRRDLPDTG
ncbi:hypothetical protein BMF35_a0450 [Aurantiacibacter gangjinensis]|nr:hypothetical protein BMF35_a0450 [Aurantiacibacter gangjinensis]